METETPKIPYVDAFMFQQLLASKRKLSRRELNRMCRKITPLVRKDGKLYCVETGDPRRQSFWIDPEIVCESKHRPELATIYTLHTWGAPHLFKPSAEEVFSMIPERLIPMVGAFEVFGPRNGYERDLQRAAMNLYYHVAATVLYA